MLDTVKYILSIFVILWLPIWLIMKISEYKDEKIRESMKEKSNIKLRSSSMYLYIGVAGTLFLFLLFILALTQKDSNETVTVIAIIGLLPFLLLGVICILIGAGKIYTIDMCKNEDYFIYTSYFGKKSKIYYNEITFIEGLNKFDFIIHTSDKKFRADMTMLGFEYFADITVEYQCEITERKKRSKYYEKNKNNNYVKVYCDKGWMILGIIFFVPFSFFLLMGLSSQMQLQEYAPVMIFLIIVILSSAYAIFIGSGITYKIDIFRDKDYFIYYSRLFRIYKIKYADIISIKPKGQATLQIETDEKKINLFIEMIGFDIFFEMLAEHKVLDKLDDKSD